MGWISFLSCKKDRFNIWPILKEHTGVNPWKLEDLIRRTHPVRKARYQRRGRTMFDFGHLRDDQFNVKATWKQQGIETRELELVGVIMVDNLKYLRRKLNALTPIYVSDILIDGISLKEKGLL